MKSQLGENTQKDSFKENPFISLLINIIIPTFILSKLSPVADSSGLREAKLYHIGPVYSLILAVSFPIIYGIVFFIRSKSFNLFSILGLISIMLTGTLGLMKANAIWIAIKEATIPVIFGCAILFSSFSKKTGLEKLFLNDTNMDIDAVNNKIEENGKKVEFRKLIVWTNNFFGYTMFVSAILNFFLAKYFLKASPGTTEFNKQLAMVTGWGSFSIAIFISLFLVFAFLKLFKEIKNMTGLELEDVLNQK